MSPCSVYQDSSGSYCVKTVLLIDRHSGRKVIAVPRVELSLSALEPSDPGPINVHPKISSLVIVLRFCEEQI